MLTGIIGESSGREDERKGEEESGRANSKKRQKKGESTFIPVKFSNGTEKKQWKTMLGTRVRRMTRYPSHRYIELGKKWARRRRRLASSLP